MDVIVVRSSDGSFKSTPFHLQYGSMKVLRAKEKIVSLTINEKEVSVKMRLGSSGEAYFIRDQSKKTSKTEDEKDVDSDTSRALTTRSMPMKNEDPIAKEFDINLEEVNALIEGNLVQHEQMIDNASSKGFFSKLTSYFSSSKKLPTDGQDKLQESLKISEAEENKKVKFANEETLSSGSYHAEKAIIIEDELEDTTNNLPEDTGIVLSDCLDKIKANPEKLEEIFYDNILNEEAFYKDPWGVLNNSNLVVKQGEYIYTTKCAIPLLISQLAFGKNLPDETLNNLLISRGMISWFEEKNKVLKFDNKKARKISFDKISKTDKLTVYDVKPKKKRSNVPSSEQLAALELKPGKNELKYTVYSRFGGKISQEVSIYLWEETDKVVISDVDGTITRSDVLGHVLPMFGSDWSHKGVVELYQKIADNGYKILYLTARALCQADTTKHYLTSKLKQEEKMLPAGPILCSPEGLINSFKREVIDRTPHVSV